MPKRTAEFWYILLSFFAIYIIWGSTYLANVWGLLSFPPFILACLRFTIAGLIIVGFYSIRNPFPRNLSLLKETALAGFFFFALGNGLLVWGLQYIESGIAALIISLQPLVIGLMMWAFYKKPPGKKSWLGLLLGIVGMSILIGQDGFITNTNWLIGFTAILIAMISWAYISVRINNKQRNESIVLIAGLQMLFGGIILFFISGIQGEWPQVDFSNVVPKSWYALVFLIIFGSIIAFSAFNYLLVKVSPVKVSTAAYINPIIALLLGWSLNNEVLSNNSIIATIILLLSVFLINADKFDQKQAAESNSN